MAESPIAPPPTVASSSPRLRSRIGWWLARGTLAFLCIIGIYLTAFPSGRGALRAAALLPGLIGLGASSNSTGLRHSEQTIDLGASSAIVDLFEQTDASPPIPGAREAVIIIAGVGDNRGDAQLVNLESSFAKSGVVVLSLTTPALIDYVLTPSDSNAVVAAFELLEHHQGVNPKAIGMLGISAGGGLISLAAADPRIRDKVAFVTLFGAYYDTTQLLADIGHRALRDASGNYTQPWHPQDVPLYVLAFSVADLLPAEEGSLIAEAFSNGTTISDTVLDTFSPAATGAYHLLAGDEPNEVEANLAKLTPAIHQLLENLSPKSIASEIHAHIYLLHDRHDEYVPYTESEDFGRWLTAQHRDHDEVLFDIFQHVEVKSGLPIGTLAGDGARLFGVLTTIMSYGA